MGKLCLCMMWRKLLKNKFSVTFVSFWSNSTSKAATNIFIVIVQIVVGWFKLHRLTSTRVFHVGSARNLIVLIVNKYRTKETNAETILMKKNNLQKWGLKNVRSASKESKKMKVAIIWNVFVAIIFVGSAWKSSVLKHNAINIWGYYMEGYMMIRGWTKSYSSSNIDNEERYFNIDWGEQGLEFMYDLIKVDITYIEYLIRISQLVQSYIFCLVLISRSRYMIYIIVIIYSQKYENSFKKANRYL